MEKQSLIINSLGIKNFRSFDADGIFLKDLNKINLLIGKNNCGKSNVLKFLKILTEIKYATGSYPNTLENQHNESNIPASILFSFSFQDLDLPTFFEHQTHLQSISRNNRIGDYWLDEVEFEFQFVNNKFKLNFKNTPSNKLDLFRNEIAISIINHLKIDLGNAKPMQVIEKYFEEKCRKHLEKLYSTVYIPDIRIIKEKNNIEKSNSVINGANLTSELALMRNHEIGEDDKFEKLRSIEEKIAQILDVSRVEIQTPQKSKQIVLIVNNKRLLLENYGTGVHDLVMLCCILMINKKSLVCIEEPEIHMHPELQRRFIKFLNETEHQYLLTTHSNTFLDFFSNNTSIYHIKYDGIRSSVNRSITDVGIREIVDELGYKASDLLQTNGIIWVEGPSDRTYLNKWILLIAPEIKEGIHYTIMFYGGKLLSHLSFEMGNQNELIQMMKINPNAFIIIDKDKIPVNKTKKRIIQEIGIKDSWVTKGMEIENYLTLSSINDWLSSKGLAPAERETYLNNKLENIIKKNNPAFKYETKKSVYAKEIIENIKSTDLDHLDLNGKIKSLISTIKIWNKYTSTSTP
jgi:predicted ATP-dependent endonuclease of OLD family